MPKRKREPEDVSAGGSAKQQRVQHKLSQATRNLSHAFKVAKGFERQKLSRRQKSAKEQNKAVDEARIDAEIAALKAIDISASAQHFLYKSLSKIKAVENSDLLSSIITDAIIPTDSASQNVHGRLCNSAPVKAAFSTAVKDILKAAGISTDKKEEGEKSRRGTESHSKSKKSQGEDAIPQEDAQSDEEDFDMYKHRLASSDESGSEDDIADLEEQLALEGIGRESSSESEDDANLSGVDISDVSLAKRVKHRPASKSKLPTTSTIIPSLTMGGYISGSDDSEIEDIDVAPKKNRPGQRTRQAIWEKKFGSSAKHLQQTDRNSGWDAKRGATDGKARNGQRKAPKGRDLRAGASDTTKSAKPAKRNQRDDTGPIHPSWEAAKKAKEKSLGNSTFTGKKISFE